MSPCHRGFLDIEGNKSTSQPRKQPSNQHPSGSDDSRPCPLPTPPHTCSRVWVGLHTHPRSPPTSCEDVGGCEPLRRPRTRRDPHTIVAPTRARSRSTNLSIYLGRRNTYPRDNVVEARSLHNNVGVHACSRSGRPSDWRSRRLRSRADAGSKRGRVAAGVAAIGAARAGAEAAATRQAGARMDRRRRRDLDGEVTPRRD